jgi:hypothetical protein
MAQVNIAFGLELDPPPRPAESRSGGLAMIESEGIQGGGYDHEMKIM